MVCSEGEAHSGLAAFSSVITSWRAVGESEIVYAPILYIRRSEWRRRLVSCEPSGS